MLMSGRIIPTILGEGQGFPGTGLLSTFWSFVVGFRTVRAPVGALLKLLMCYNPRVLRLEVDWLALVHHLESSLFQPIYFMSSTAMPFFLKIVPCPLPVSQETKSGANFAPPTGLTWYLLTPRFHHYPNFNSHSFAMH